MGEIKHITDNLVLKLIPLKLYLKYTYIIQSMHTEHIKPIQLPV